MAAKLKGRYRAKAKQWDLGESSNKTPQIAVLFEITEGDEKGSTITWYGFFTDKTTERTIESLRIAGWSGGDIDVIEDLPAEVELVIEVESYTNPQTQVTSENSKVQWVNRPGGISMKNRMEDGARKSLAERLRGQIAKVDEKIAASQAAAGVPASSPTPAGNAGGNGGKARSTPF